MRQPAWLWRAGGYRAWLWYWHLHARVAKWRDDRRSRKFTHPCNVCQARGYVAPHAGQHAVAYPPAVRATRPPEPPPPAADRPFTYVPLPEGVPLTREVLREHFDAMGGTFGPPASAHYHEADAAPITGGWACYCSHPEARERP